MRNFFDNLLALLGTVLLHALIIALLLVGFRWEKTPPPPLRTTLKATVVSDEAFRLAEDEIEQAAVKEQPDPEPEATAEPIEPALPDPVAAEQERERIAEQVAAEAARKREAEAARKREAEAQQQREIEQQREAAAQAEQERQAELERAAEQAREREAAAEVERQKRAAEEAEQKRREAAEAERKRKEAEAQRQREAEEERKRREEQQRQQALEAQLRDALEAEEARAGAIDAGLLAQYVEVIRQKVERNWIRPPGVPDGIRCEVSVRQLRNGEVVSVRIGDCAGGEALIRSIETAVRKASPLPLPRDPSLFEPNLRFPFKTGE